MKDMLLNNCAKTEDGVSLDRMRGEVAAMLRVCFEGSVEENGDCLRLVLPEGPAFDIFVREA